MREDYVITKKRRIIENIAILGLIIMAICTVIAAIFHFAGLETFVYGTLEVSHTIQILLAIFVAVVAWRLYRRSRLAWECALMILACGIVVDFLSMHHPLHIVLLVCEILVLIIFIVYHADFQRHGVRGQITPLTDEQKQTVLDLVRKYGQNPGSYLTMEDDKSIYFGKSVKGVIPYGIVGDVVVVNGDPICAPEDMEAFVKEFHEFCHDNIYRCVFLSVTDAYLDVYKKMGFGHVKCGEEPRFDVENYNLKGGKMAKVRAEVNHATKAGVTVLEYKPLEKKDEAIEKEFDRITSEWLDDKKTGELVFTLGGVGFDNPLDKRYFYALNEDGKMVGYVVFVPFGGMTGFMADVTRRAKDAPRGVMELIIYSAIEQFKEDGIKWLSMGLAPLARMNEGEDKDAVMTKLLNYVYNHLNGVYGFKDLYRAKEKYNPSLWVPGYFIFDPRVPNFDIAYAVVAIQNPRGAADYLKAYFKKDK